MGSAAGEELFRPAARYAEPAQVSRRCACGAGRQSARPERRRRAFSTTTSSRARPRSRSRLSPTIGLHKESSKSSWTSQELYICARLLEDIHAYPESARYYFALYNSKDLPNAQETAIAGLIGILLTAPETPIRFGSGELSMYRDIATLDQGPGYLNGILSLILNTSAPASYYSEEEQRAVPYFHRSRGS